MPDNKRKGEIVELLRQADAELQQQRLSPEADQRLQQLIQGRRGRGWRPALLLVPLAAATAALLIWALAPPPQAPQRDRQELAGFSLVSGTVRQQQKQVGCFSSSCTLAALDQRTRLELVQGAVVQRHNRHIQVLRGRTTFDVKPRRRHQGVLQVLVSHGRIEVLGTVFSVQQGQGRGKVRLRRGAIRFVSRDGRRRELAPGQELSWPLPPPVAEVPPPKKSAKIQPARPPRTPRKLTPVETESLHNEIARLRSQGRYGRAVAALRQALPRIAHRGTREIWSYELGEILTRQLKNQQAACRHWARHLRIFGTRQYGQEIRRAQEKLGCR